MLTRGGIDTKSLGLMCCEEASVQIQRLLASKWQEASIIYPFTTHLAVGNKVQRTASLVKYIEAQQDCQQRASQHFSPLSWLPGFPHSSVGKESACNAGDPSSIPGSGRPPGEENGNSLQYSCLGNPMNRGAWRFTILGVAKELNTTEPLTLN